MKKIVLTLTSAALFAACGNNTTTTAESAAETSAAVDTIACYVADCGMKTGGACTCTNGCTCENCKREMTYQSSPFLYESELAWQTPVAGLKRQIMGYDDRLMTVKIDFEAGCDGGGQHAHPHSQTSVVVSGVFEVTIDGVTKTLKAGDGFYAAPNLVHGAVCIEAGTLIDAFSPVREDFLK